MIQTPIHFPSVGLIIFDGGRRPTCIKCVVKSPKLKNYTQILQRRVTASEHTNLAKRLKTCEFRPSAVVLNILSNPPKVMTKLALIPTPVLK